jgi:hypothetical protein
MNRIVASLLVLVVLAFDTGAHAKAEACPPNRISDEQAIRIAKAELAKRVKAFDPTNYTWAVVEDDCDLRVDIEKRNELATGRKSSVILTRAGKVRRYVGGM